MAEETYGFSEEGMRRAVNAIRRVEGEGADLTGRRRRPPILREEIAILKITAVGTGADSWKYAWVEVRPDASGWIEVEGRSGTLTENYAMDIARRDGAFAVDAVLAARRGSLEKAPGDFEQVWQILGGDPPVITLDVVTDVYWDSAAKEVKQTTVTIEGPFTITAGPTNSTVVGSEPC